MVRKSSQIPQREHNESRLRRAKSWLELSKNSKSADEKFIFLWIAFNAAYGTELPPPDTSAPRERREKKRFTDFVNKIVEHDRGETIKKIFEPFKNPDNLIRPIRKLKDNEYVFRPFWDWVIQDELLEDDWRAKLENKNRKLDEALNNRDISFVLRDTLERLYVLRNQIFHGGTTFEKGWGRHQVRNGSDIMKVLMELVLKIMEDVIKEDPNSDVWGRLDYPRVRDE